MDSCDNDKNNQIKELAKVFDSAKAAERSACELCFRMDKSLNGGLFLKRDFERHLSNTIQAINSNKQYFASRYKEEYSRFNDAANKIVEIDFDISSIERPNSLKLRDILRRARNWSEHPEDAACDKESDRYLADMIGIQQLLELFNSIAHLLNASLSHCSDDDRAALFAYSDRTRSRIIDWQSKVCQAIEEKSDVFEEHPGLLEQASSFLRFFPSGDNIRIIEADSAIKKLDKDKYNAEKI